MVAPEPPIDAPVPIDTTGSVSASGGTPPPSVPPSGDAPQAYEGEDTGAGTETIEWSYRQKRINVRPPRTIPVKLPNGRPEPSTWPPSEEYRRAVENIPESETPVHPLWKFFHLTQTAMSTPDESQSAPPELGGLGPSEANPGEWMTRSSYQVCEGPSLYVGRAWSAPELRMKSFAELHTLWYLCLRERNTFATVKEERKRWGVHKRMTQMDVGQADRAVRR
jgi:large subunit ribosomal protein L47